VRVLASARSGVQDGVLSLVVGEAVRVRGSGSDLQRELLRLLQPPVPRRERLVSERLAPVLAELGDRLAGRPAEEIYRALEAAVRDAGATPDEAALREFALAIEAGDNPFR
jgi:hypothetical protein